jgi:hypothetical protein
MTIRIGGMSRRMLKKEGRSARGWRRTQRMPADYAIREAKRAMAIGGGRGKIA